MVAPGVLQLQALVARADGVLPMVGVPEAVAAAVYHATAGEAHELRLQVGQCLSKVLTQAVTLVSVLRHERHVVQNDVTLVEHQQLQGSIFAVSSGYQRSLMLMQTVKAVRLLRLLPLCKRHITNHLNDSVAQQFRIPAPGLWLYECDAHRHGLVAPVDHAHGEVVLLARLHHDAVEAVVLQAEALPAFIVLVLLDALSVQLHAGVRLVEHPGGGTRHIHGRRLDVP